MQYSIAFNTNDHAARALFVQDSAGAVRPAAPKEILAAAREVVLQEIQRGQPMNSPKLVREFLQLRLNRSLEHEVFGIMYLNPLAELIAYDEPFRGSLSSAPVYPREIVKAALAHNAASVILAHNHPSGDAEPSRADVNITRQLKDALALVGTNVLDHLVVGGRNIVSFAEKGWL
ncbi:JAB domain-containing protein [Achromobacter ruhlandii]|uniref:JAB domain-containing protein n=1 Tax=Achromobacter ruhlandii TaxID=72557 RepID=UPI0007BFC95F|nr:JAB domain-containing protein [Achromobacter ruhlandii]